MAQWGRTDQTATATPDILVSEDIAAPAVNTAPPDPVALTQLVFIDGAVTDAAALAAGVAPGTTAVILNASAGGVAQIAAYLAAHALSNLAAIAIVGDGADGMIRLGNSVLTAASLDAQAAALASIGAAVAPGGSLALYGCDVAQDASGLAFVDQLSSALGGIAVAAASHLLGAASRGGNFNLDTTTSPVATPVFFTAETVANYAGTLVLTSSQMLFSSASVLASNNRIEQFGVIGQSIVSGSAANVTTNTGVSSIKYRSVALDAAAGHVFVVNTISPNANNQILTGSLGGALTPLLPTYTYNQVYSVAVNPQTATLYFGGALTPTNGYAINSVSEAGGTATQVTTETNGPVNQLAIDVGHNLLFAADGSVVSGIELQAINLTTNQTNTDASNTQIHGQVAGVALLGNTLYFSVVNTNSNGAPYAGIYATTVTFSGVADSATASFGTPTRVVVGPTAFSTYYTSLAVDPTTNTLYANELNSGSTDANVVAFDTTNFASSTTLIPFTGNSGVYPQPFGLTIDTQPVVSVSGAVGFTLGGAAVAAQPTITVSDPVYSNLASASVAITTGLDAADTLAATTTGTAITANYNAATGVLSLAGNDTLANYQQVLASVTFATTSTSTASRSITWTVSDGLITSTSPVSTITMQAACYCAGSMILTEDGEVPVERLRAGQSVRTASGQLRRVHWVGHRRIALAKHPRPQDVMPVCIQPGAFGPNLPTAPLSLSPDHAVFFDGALIPIRYLINGASIRQEQPPSVHYFHIELDSHDILLANGLPAESYLDTGNRAAFANGGTTLQLHPNFALQIWDRQACAPLVRDGAELEAARSYLLHRAEALGHTTTCEPDLRAIVNGQEIRGTRHGSTHRFPLPPGAATVRLQSRSAVPAQMYDANADHRRLGVAISRLALDGQTLPLIDGGLTHGWHDAETNSDWRWTDGDAALPVTRADVLEVEVAMTERYWQVPVRQPHAVHRSAAKA